MSLRKWPTQHFSDTLQYPRQLRRHILGVQQQGLVAPWWCKNVAEGCFRKGTGNDVWKYYIAPNFRGSKISWISNFCDKNFVITLSFSDSILTHPFFSDRSEFYSLIDIFSDSRLQRSKHCNNSARSSKQQRHHLPVTPAQLMRLGIGRNTSCAMGDFA